jgi:Rha family phage regulatory protein
MNKLNVISHHGEKAVDSREVAAMIGKPHNDLMKSIRSYIEHLTEGDFSLSDFFIESTYTDPTGRTLPCYLLTQKGCDMVANKTTGKKGVLFTAAYVTAFEAMREHISKSLPDETKKVFAEAKLNNSRARVASVWLKIAGLVNVPEYKGICASYASAALSGKETIALPECAEHLYTATEIGEMFGVSKTRIGAIANMHGLKIPDYGKTVWDKSPYSSKQVETFRYNSRAVDEFKRLIESAR